MICSNLQAKKIKQNHKTKEISVATITTNRQFGNIWRVRIQFLTKCSHTLAPITLWSFTKPYFNIFPRFFQNCKANKEHWRMKLRKSQLKQFLPFSNLEIFDTFEPNFWQNVLSYTSTNNAIKCDQTIFWETFKTYLDWQSKQKKKTSSRIEKISCNVFETFQVITLYNLD